VIYCIEIQRTRIPLFLFVLEEKGIIGSDKIYLVNSITAGNPAMVEKIIPLYDNLNSIHVSEVSILERAISMAVFLQNLKASEHIWEEKEAIDVESAIEIIRILIYNGALLNESLRFSFIVHEAIQSPTVLKVLIENGLDINKELELNSETYHLLDYMLIHIAMTDKVILSGEEVDLTKNEKLNEYLLVLDLMLEKQIEIPYGDVSPFQVLAIKGVSNNNLKLIELLLSQNRIKINFSDSEGKTLIARAQELKYHDIIELLLKNGARPNGQGVKRN